MDRKSRISFLNKKNQGLKIKKEYLESVSDILRVKVTALDLLDLEDSYVLEKKTRKQTELVYENKKMAYIKQWMAYDREDFQDALLEISKKLGKEEIFLFDKKSELVGALKLQSDIVFWFAIDLLLSDGDSLTISDPQAKNGILLDYFEEITEKGPVIKYELVIWRENWLKLVNNE